MASPAPALSTLKRQLLAVYPNMGAANIGIMADAAHIAAGTSDHILGNAIDIPVAGGPGAGAPHLALGLALLADPRAHYLIYNRTFYHKGRVPAPYTGTSPHTAHAHLSIDTAKRADASTWDIGQTGGDVGYYTLSQGATGVLVGELQERLRITGADMRTVTGGVFDEVTEQLVKNFQDANGLTVDGIVGEDTWTLLISVTTALPIVVAPAPAHVCQPPADYSALKTKAALVDDFIKSVSAVKVVS